MQRSLKSKCILTVALVAVATLLTVTARAEDDEATFCHAWLTGVGEVPPNLVEGKGLLTGRLSADGGSIAWTLSWTGLTGPAQAAHIHFGPPQNTGAVVVFFCGGGGRPACPDGPEHSGSVSGTWTAADIVAVPAQNVTAGDFVGFLGMLHVHLGYANIHTPLFPAGEVRGQVSVQLGEPDDN